MHFQRARGLPKSQQLRTGSNGLFATDDQRGVAGAALKAALEAIKSKGGGLVEAYPMTHCESYAFWQQSTHGVVSMFEKKGFTVVVPLGTTKFSECVLVRRTV
jgi:hypothetical protein